MPRTRLRSVAAPMAPEDLSIRDIGRRWFNAKPPPRKAAKQKLQSRDHSGPFPAVPAPRGFEAEQGAQAALTARCKAPAQSAISPPGLAITHSVWGRARRAYLRMERR